MTAKTRRYFYSEKYKVTRHKMTIDSSARLRFTHMIFIIISINISTDSAAGNRGDGCRGRCSGFCRSAGRMTEIIMSEDWRLPRLLHPTTLHVVHRRRSRRRVSHLDDRRRRGLAAAAAGVCVVGRLHVAHRHRLDRFLASLSNAMRRCRPSVSRRYR